MTSVSFLWVLLVAATADATDVDSGPVCDDNGSDCYWSDSTAALLQASRRGNDARLMQEGEDIPEFPAKEAINKSWLVVHENVSDQSSRVPRKAFVEYCMRNVPPNSGKIEAYRTYVNELFNTSLAMMLPTQKTDLGKHCFGYASLLSGEFYGDKPEDRLQLAKEGRPIDGVHDDVRKDLDADWAAVEKDENDRVTLAAFKKYLKEKHGTENGFDAFLEQDFKSSLAMMLPEDKSTLGGHCFRYGALMAGEFYFSGSEPSDVLKLVN